LIRHSNVINSFSIISDDISFRQDEIRISFFNFVFPCFFYKILGLLHDFCVALIIYKQKWGKIKMLLRSKNNNLKERNMITSSCNEQVLSVFKRRFFIAFLCLTFFLTLHNFAQADEKTRITFVHTNDLDRIESSDGKGGFAKLAAIVKLERLKNKNTFFTHGGDAISPSILSSIDQGKHVIELLNDLELDFMTLGNHEFDFGPDVAKQRISEAKFPIISTNVFEYGETRIPGTIESKLVNVDGYKIGFIGITTPETVEVSSPMHVQFFPIVESAHGAITKLKEQGADFIVALSHTRIGENFSLLKSNIGIDLLLGGHDEVVLNYYDDVSAMVISKYEAEQIAVIDIDMERIHYNGTSRLKWEPHFKNINSAIVVPDPVTYKKVQQITKDMHEEFAVVVGKTLVELDTHRAKVRETETAFSNYMVDAMREKYGTDIAIMNGGGVRGNKIYVPNSDITLKDIYTELPFGKHIAVLEMKGADIQTAIEAGLGSIDGISGGFPHVSGMSYVFDAAKPVGSRIITMSKDDHSIDPDATYTVAVDEYIYNGGEGYYVIKEKGNLIVSPSTSLKHASIVAEKIKADKTISPKIDGRIKRIN
jgi:5'-nucleotidase/UDP-sugar diphosphatase